MLLLKKIGNRNQANSEIWLQNAIKNIPKGNKILDAGAGELQYKKFCEHLNYTSQDFGKYDGQGDEGSHPGKWDNSKLDIVSDITNIPVETESFDAVMCIEVFEHIPEPIKAVKEFSRIIKKGGTLIITAPFCSMTHFAPYHFYTGYNKYWYEKILVENGFEITDLQYNGNYFEYLAQEMRRLPEMAKKYAKINPFILILLKILIKFNLLFLHIFSNRDSNSKEMLSYGLHVKAIKK
jgi:ubiquinone/menaquinone biosynthesis C-methylase UbiE